MRLIIDKIHSFIFHAFALLIGVIFCALGIFYPIDFILFKLNAERVSCEIVQIIEDTNSDNERCYDLYVSYSYGGIDYERIKIDDWDKPVQVGKSISMYCDSKNPKDLRKNNPSVITIIINIIPLLFGLFALFIGITPILGIYQDMKLLRTGKVIYATIDSIEEIRRHKHNSIYELNCYYYDEFIGKAYRFREMLFDKSQYEKLHEGDTIKIVVNPEDYRYYKIDL